MVRVPDHRSTNNIAMAHTERKILKSSDKSNVKGTNS